MINMKVTLSLSVALAMTSLQSFSEVTVAQDAMLSTYVGGSKTDALSGAAILPNGSIAVAGTFDATLGGPKGTTPEGGRGAVMLYDNDGKPLAQAELPGQVSDMDADAQGNVYVAGEFGVRKLDGSLKRTLLESEVGGAEARIAAGPDGGAIVLADKEVTLLDATGKTKTSFAIKCSFATDLTYYLGGKRIVVCGFDNKRGLPPGQRNYPVQVA